MYVICWPFVTFICVSNFVVIYYELQLTYICHLSVICLLACFQRAWLAYPEASQKTANKMDDALGITDGSLLKTVCGTISQTVSKSAVCGVNDITDGLYN